MYQLRLFSTPELRAEGTPDPLLPPGKPLAVLAYLAVEARPVRRTELVELLWPEVDLAHGKGSLRQALWSVRKALDPDVFPADDPLEIAPGRVEVDLHRFREHVAAGELDVAAELWAGGLMEGLEFPRARAWRRWVDDLRAIEERRFGDALAEAADEARVGGDLHSARKWMKLAVEVQPYSPGVRTALVEVLLDLRSYQAAQEALSAARTAIDDGDWSALEERLEALRAENGTEAGSSTLRTEFVGRTAEFSTLAAAWRRARKGASEVSLVLGGPGIGKTRLVEELLALVRSESAPAVAVKAVEAERSLRWGTASELVRALHGLPGAAGISNRSASVLTRLVPSLGTLRDETRDEVSGSVEAAAVTDALLDLATAVADESPIVIFVDDLQWVDRESRAMLSHLARNLAKEPVLLILSCRSGERDPEVTKALESLARLEGTQTIELRPLDAQEVSELLALLLDGIGPEEVDGLGQRIHGITRGSPLFVVEILKLLHQEGRLNPADGGKWRLDPSCLAGSLPVPENVESAIRLRLEDLGAHAELVAIQMAEHARPIEEEELRRQSGLDPFQTSEALRELFGMDLVRRDRQGRIGYVHDAVMEVAQGHLRSPGWSRKAEEFGARRNGSPFNRRIVAAAVMAGVALVALAFAGYGGLGPMAFLAGDGGFGGTAMSDSVGAEASSPMGHGRVLVLLADSAAGYWLTPPTHRDGEWAWKDTTFSTFHHAVVGVARLPSDSLLWFVHHTDTDDDTPYVALLQPEGSPLSFWETAGDVGFRDLSPDGETVLLWEERLDAPWYAHDLLAVDRTTRRARLVVEAPERVWGADWSPDGIKLAVVLRAPRDTLHIMNTRGQRQISYSFPEFEDLPWVSWCPDSRHLAFVGVTEERMGIGILDTSSGDYDVVETGIAVQRRMVCVGDGPGVVYLEIPDGRYSVMYRDLRDQGPSTIMQVPEGVRLGSMYWVPDRAAAVLQELAIEPAAPPVEWGRRVQLRAIGSFSDGTVQPLDVEWSALDPTRASVDSTGQVRGNEVGPAPVVAHFGPWLTDTVMVDVLEWERPDVALGGDFQAEDLSNWVQFGYPPSRAVEVDGETVLSLEGDGSRQDVLVSRDKFSLAEGGRVEVVFRMRLTRTDRQRIVMCLHPDDPDTSLEDPDYARERSAWGFCLTYPSGEQMKFDSTEVALTYNALGVVEMLHLEGGFDTGDWTQFSLEIQPDGQVALFVNQELLHTLEDPLILEEGTDWRIMLGGASADTDLYVRSLTVYTGAGEA